MNILIKTRDQQVEAKVTDVIEELERVQQELVDQIKDSLSNLVTMDTLYDIRNHIDELIVNWVDEDVEL